ncbi:hypothetical protein A374_16193 [Fictibacillus macauensis ZFHKF-1]|uniref:Uncharacterized protein n=1 Tax=Fictibacillus macauensis ZFHKF-1 TaxID=1196324 RepID=I8UC20_9BACL|nr:hypothetical protein [Fictibacillus macauensis]EIT84343.1 hypothetical protein A374_16193 [Fictibacillus macauensis ZFHKF-1]
MKKYMPIALGALIIIIISVATAVYFGKKSTAESPERPLKIIDHDYKVKVTLPIGNTFAYAGSADYLYFNAAIDSELPNKIVQYN